jgi:carbon storage regulator
MLILGRRTNEQIVIGNDIVVTVVACRKGHCRLGLTAPDHVTVHRQEIYDAIRRRPGSSDVADTTEPPAARMSNRETSQ